MIKREHKPIETSADLDWLAFQYIANELTDAELQAFEARLESDLAACEAVARAVELSCAVHAAQVLSADVVPAASKSRWQSRLSWLAAGAATAAAVMALISAPQWMATRPSVAAIAPTSVAGEGETVTTELAVAWSESMPVVPANAVQLPDEGSFPVSAAVDAESIVGESSLANGGVATEDLPPSWMLAAVRGLAEAEEMMDVEMNMGTSEPFGSESVDN